MNQPCVFCDIARGDAPASVVHRDERVMAFMDIRPVNRGHLLVVPLEHKVSVLELDGETAGRVLEVARRLAAALPGSGVRCEGFNLFLADGEPAGQEVFHVHLHVLPRFAGDTFRVSFASGYDAPPPRSELDEVALRIRRAAGWE